MHVHIDAELLEKYPWVAVLIGLIGMLLFGWLAAVCGVEYKRLSESEQPEQVTVETARLSAESPRKWVTLRGGVWHCDRALRRERQAPERWVLGRVANTQIPVTDAGFETLIVVEFDGDVQGAEVQGKPVTGVVTSEDDKVWGASVPREMKEMGRFRTVLVLCAGAGPKQALKYALAGTALFLLCAGFAGYYGRLWIRRREEAPQPPGAPTAVRP